jgi:hypothetical protein
MSDPSQVRTTADSSVSAMAKELGGGKVTNITPRIKGCT